MSVSFTVSYNTSSIKQMFAQALQTSVAQVSAATFDSSLLPSGSGSSAQLGTSGNPWTSINGIINFNGNNVGIGPNFTSAQGAFDVNGGIRLVPQSSGQPGCTGSNRGTLWLVSGAYDHLQLCVNVSSSPQWVQIY